MSCIVLLYLNSVLDANSVHTDEEDDFIDGKDVRKPEYRFAPKINHDAADDRRISLVTEVFASVFFFFYIWNEFFFLHSLNLSF